MPSISKSHDYLSLLLREVADKEQIATALGMIDPDTKDEEFWTGQRRGARRRFLQLCLQIGGFDQSLLLEDLTENQADEVGALAEKLLMRPGFSYTEIRIWFLTRGQFEYNKALNLRKEREALASKVLRVLAILNTGGAKYVSYEDGMYGKLKLVDSPDDAHQFQIYSISETDKAYLLEMSDHFVTLLKEFDAKQVKVLVGTRSPSLE